LGGGANDYTIALAVNTTGVTGVAVIYDVMTIRNPWNGGANTRISASSLQYRVGTSGDFTTLAGLEYQNNTTTQTGAVTTPQNLQSKSVLLPAACDNQAVVQLRWLARDVSGAGARPSFAVDNVHAQRAYTVTASAGAHGAIAPSGTVRVLPGGSASFTITPDAGYAIAAVVVDGVSRGAVASYAFTNVAADHTIAASFATAGDGKILSFRADLANGTGPYAVPGSGSPWVDLTGAHPGTLFDFAGTPSSGWKGNGTRLAPYRLEFNGEEQAGDTRVTVPAGSIPELQTVGPASVALWFRSSFNAPDPAAYEYLLEWVEHPTNIPDPEFEGRGFSVAVENAQIGVYDNGWAEGLAIQPDTWYHVVAVKNTSDLRLYVNGVRRFTGNHPHQGVQESELTLGCSTFRRFEGYTGNAIYGEFFGGSLAQATVWARALTDQDVTALFAADSALYLPNPPRPWPPTRLVSLAAAQANGTAPYPIPGAGSPWVDLAAPRTDATLHGFDGTASSGWQGSGTTASPYRLRFDGVNDVATVAAASLPELQNAIALTAEAWFQTGPTPEAATYRYVLEWLQGFGSTSGLSVAVVNGKLQVYLGTPYWTDVADVIANTWYHLAVAKEPGAVRVYVNGHKLYEQGRPLIGDQTTEVVLGGSTWRGAGAYGDFFDGAIGQAVIWNGAFDDSTALAVHQASRSLYPSASLTVNVSGNGSVTRSPSSPVYPTGSSVQLTALPAPNASFVGWSGDASGSANPITVTMTADKVVTAIFGGVAAVPAGDPRGFGLLAVAPNPSVGRTRILYALPRAAAVRVAVLDVQGRAVAELVNSTRAAGVHEVEWDGVGAGGRARAGVYFVVYRTPERAFVRRVLLTP
jgi:hypothetical protein